MSVDALMRAFAALPSWPAEGDLDRDGWQRYRDAARAVQQSGEGELDQALVRFLDRAEGMEAALDETRLFLLSRVTYALPAAGPAEERRIWKGWVNWPAPDADGRVDLSWPVDWHGGDPRLIAPFAGAEGHRYAAVEEFRDLRARFGPRDVG